MVPSQIGTVENLFQFDSPHDLAPRLVEIYREQSSQREYIRTLAHRIAEGLTPPASDSPVVESYLGFMAAAQLGRYLEPYDHFRCLSRAAWDCIRSRSADKEQKSPQLTKIHSYGVSPLYATADRPLGYLERFRNKWDDTQQRAEIFRELAPLAIGDLSAQGRKLPALVRLFHLLTELENENSHLLAKPALWDFDNTPAERPFDPLLDSRLSLHRIQLGQRSFNIFTLNTEEIAQLRDAVLQESKEETLDTFLGALDYGIEPYLLAEALLLTAAQLCLSVSGEHWRKPVWSFCQIRALVEALEYFQVEEQQRLVLLEALLFQNTVEQCQPFRLVETFSSSRPEELEVQPNELEEAIDLGIAQDALSAMSWMLDHSRISPRLVENLSVRAARSDTGRPDGLGLHFAYAALDAYHTSTLPLRNPYLLALVKFLAERQKIREFDHALVHALKA